MQHNVQDFWNFLTWSGKTKVRRNKKAFAKKILDEEVYKTNKYLKQIKKIYKKIIEEDKKNICDDLQQKVNSLKKVVRVEKMTQSTY